ncbi:hypothetical protein [Synoicihabitans lomoniglobus]|uniref:hypothetical protein n=1 Tax=Synoicihabitans lomoniglobus TaxID=2909285 RepID=UPI002ED44CF8|nr:hypothetical protein [Opitutaceae bacterium LMO-M01]
MDRNIEKKLLVIACTCDRLEWEQKWRPRLSPSHGHAWWRQVGTWAGWASSLMVPFLPRWARLGARLMRIISKR